MVASPKSVALPATGGKRKWTEVDWEIVMEAQSFVAVYASTEQDEEVPPVQLQTTKKTSGKRGAMTKKKKTSTMKAMVTVTTKRSGRSVKTKSIQEEEEAVITHPATEGMGTTSKDTDEFWIAQLQDDVTADMLDLEDAVVQVTWLNKKSGVSNRYEYAYDERIDVQSILCHVYVHEFDDNTFEITKKSMARIQRSLERTKSGNFNAIDDEDDVDDEKPPASSRRKRKVTVTARSDDGDDKPSRRSRGSGGRVSNTSSKKLSKREAEMHIPPRYTTIDADKYEDNELFGTHPYHSMKGDIFAANTEVIRAVLTTNHKLLKKLTTDKSAYKEINTFQATRSVDVQDTPLKIAIDRDDLVAAAMLLKAHKIKAKDLAAAPEVSLPTHSTGSHTSAFSDYNRRAINASRGGKEGNNALMADTKKPDASLDTSYIWHSKTASVKMLTILYPKGEWNEGYYASNNIAYAARNGNYKLTHKAIEILAQKGGWGFNELHYKVLGDGTEDLPAFRSVSAIKQAFQTKIRPLHLAAINPNKKYLEILWESAGTEWSAVKDDYGYEPIHYAAVCEGTEPLQFLLERRCNLFARTKSRFTPIMCAINTQREDNAILMLKHAAEEDGDVLVKLASERGPSSRQPIHYAAMNGCVRVLEELLKLECVDVNSVSADKITPLILAAQHGHLECVKLLIAHNAKVDLGDKLKKTPLINAVKNGNTKIAAFLINNSANVNAFDTSQNSVVHYAASYGWKSCLELLADAGADFWARNSWGFVPLTCALLKQRLHCSEFIFERDADKRFVDFRDRQGCTMLLLQCKHSKNLAQIQYLLEKGLNPNIPDSENEYPLQTMITRASKAHSDNNANIATENESFFIKAIRLLLDNGALAQYEIPKETTTERDNTTQSEKIIQQPLHLAMIGNQRTVFDMLLNTYGASPDAKGSSGLDAWMVAASLGEPGNYFLEALLQHHKKTHRNKPLELNGKQTKNGNRNFFHVVAKLDPMNLISPKLVRQCADMCPDTLTLMNEKDSYGWSPLLILLGSERARIGESESPRSVSKVEERVKECDIKYSQLVELFVEKTTDLEAYIQYVHPSKCATSIMADSSMDRNNDDDHSRSDQDNDKNEGESEEDAGGVKEKQGRSKVIKNQTALHLIANRQLSCDAKNIKLRWFGSNLMKTVFKIRPNFFDTETINFPDHNHHKTALYYAVEVNDLQSVNVLLTNGADPNHSPWRCKVCKNSSQPLNTKQTCTSNCGKELVATALYIAVERGNTAITKTLLKNGAKVGCFVRKTMDTPLHIALQKDNIEITEALLAHGANLSQQNAVGASPLHLAVQAKKSIPAKEPHEGEVIYTDLSKNNSTASVVNTGLRDKKSLTAIEIALQDKRAKQTVILGDDNNRTPIHFAAGYRDMPLLRALVNISQDKRATVNTLDSLGRSPLHYAINAAVISPDASFDVERFLLQCGSDINAQDNFQFTPLHFALFKVDFEWQYKYDKEKKKANDTDDTRKEREDGTYESKKLKAFLEVISKIPKKNTDPVETVSNLSAVRGVNVNAQDVLGRTPLHLAAATGAFVCASTILAVHSKEQSKQKLLSLEDVEKFTPLGSAVLHLRQTTIMTLLQSHADVNGKIHVKSKVIDTLTGEERDKIKPLSYFYYAVSHSLTGICHLFLAAKFCRRQAIEDAILCGQFQLASNLITLIEMANDNTLLNRVNDQGETLLHSLAKVNKPFDNLARRIAWTLIDAGTNSMQQNKKGNSALHYAAKIGNIHLLDFLLYQQCDVNQQNGSGETPPLYALKKSKTLNIKEIMDVLQYFLDKPGVNIHAVDHMGLNLLTAFLDRFGNQIECLKQYFAWVETQAHFTWVETLLKRGVDPNGKFTSMVRKDMFRNPALAKSSVNIKMTALIRMIYTSSAYTRVHMIGLLLRYGAKITGTDGEGNSFLMHLVSQNLVHEIQLALGKIKNVRDPTDTSKKILKALHIPSGDIKLALNQANRSGRTVLHFAMKPVEYGSYENTFLLKQFIDAGGNIRAKDKDGLTIIDYARSQASRFVFRFLKKEYPNIVTQSEEACFRSDDEMMFEAAPNYAEDAVKYVQECEENGKIKRTRIDPKVNNNCDVGNLSHVHGKLDDNSNLIKGEEYDALLTKVDVKNGRFGLNVFYRMQLVLDEIQGIYILFTNWGRIGETGKYQNTPFHSEEDGVSEFKKIFRSKTGNVWEARQDFVKRDKKYNLIQRVNHHTELDKEITCPFIETAKAEKTTLPDFRNSDCAMPSVTDMLHAITDIRNLQLAATQQCDFNGDLPLAEQEGLRAALKTLHEIRDLIEERNQVSDDIQKASGTITEDGGSSLADLSETHTKMTEKISEKSSRYYEVMPCDEDAFGSAIKGFDSVQDVNKEITRLRLLMEIMETYKMILGAKRNQHTIHPLEYCYNAMQVRLSSMPKESKEAQFVSEYFFKGTREHDRKNYRISNLFQVERHGEKNRFFNFLEENPTFKEKHSHLLWHGTRRTNLMGILSQGLRIAPPEAPHQGYAYGKGLYFADISAKSLNYCDAPYVITSTSIEKDGEVVEKKRRVHYMLLCEVALGTPTELVTATFYDTIPEGIQSVKALSRNTPHPAGALVSPMSGALMHMGRVVVVGESIPIEKVWAKTEPNPQPTSWYERNPKFTEETQAYLEKVVDKLGEGESFIVEEHAEKAHFITYNFESKTIKIEVVDKISGNDADDNDRGLTEHYDITAKITVSEGDRFLYSYNIRRYRNMLYRSAVDEGYTLITPNRSEYAEYIVYNEAQARIRYIVEVESV